MLIGYARVSTQDQTLRLQHDALTDGGCEKLFRGEALRHPHDPPGQREAPRVRAQGAMSSWCGNSIALGAPSAI